MKIYVCVKHVPDTAARIKLVGECGYDETVKFVMNPYDEYAVEEAVKIAETKGGEVIVVTVGKKSAEISVRSALAMGAHRGILVTVDDQFPDSVTTSLALKAAIEQDGQPDLILTGKQSVDSEGMQTQYRLAYALGMPIANEVVALSMEDGMAAATCEVDGGSREVAEIPLPCVIGATKGLNEPRYPKLPDILKAKKKPLKVIALSELGIGGPACGSRVDAIEVVPERGAARMLQGSVREMVENLVQVLKDEEKVL